MMVPYATYLLAHHPDFPQVCHCVRGVAGGLHAWGNCVGWQGSAHVACTGSVGGLAPSWQSRLPFEPQPAHVAFPNRQPLSAYAPPPPHACTHTHATPTWMHAHITPLPFQGEAQEDPSAFELFQRMQQALLQPLLAPGAAGLAAGASLAAVLKVFHYMRHTEDAWVS